jgi:hypothetical protein
MPTVHRSVLKARHFLLYESRTEKRLPSNCPTVDNLLQYLRYTIAYLVVYGWYTVGTPDPAMMHLVCTYEVRSNTG